KVQVTEALVVQQTQFMGAGDPDQGDPRRPVCCRARGDGHERHAGQLQLEGDRLAPTSGEDIGLAMPIADPDVVFDGRLDPPRTKRTHPPPEGSPERPPWW